MKLFYRKYGEGTPIIILHGLFGQCDNWQTQAKAFAESGYSVYAVDQRNHGLSPHSDTFNYDVMADDLAELMDTLKLPKAILIGHSMGGKTVLNFIKRNAERVASLIVADIAPKYYKPHHQDVIKALQAVDFNSIKTRRDAEDVLAQHLPDIGTRQFLLKNIYWATETQLAWRFNLNAIVEHIEEVGKEIDFTSTYTNAIFKTLFMRGEKSRYILDSDIPDIRIYFPDAEFVTIENAGHWLHAEKPKEFVTAVLDFLR